MMMFLSRVSWQKCCGGSPLASLDSVCHHPVASLPLWDQSTHIIIVQQISLKSPQCVDGDGVTFKVVNWLDHRHSCAWQSGVQVGPHLMPGFPASRRVVEGNFLASSLQQLSLLYPH